MKWLDELPAFEREAILAADAAFSAVYAEVASAHGADPKPDMGFAVLDGQRVVSVSFLVMSVWATKHPDATQLAREDVNGYTVSTVFLTTPGGWQADRQPLHFETMVWDQTGEKSKQQYRTYSEALAGHRRTVARITERGRL